jgi:hypothetical protein
MGRLDPDDIRAQGYLLNIYVKFLFLEPSVSQKNAKNQYAVLPGISNQGVYRQSYCIYL